MSFPYFDPDFAAFVPGGEGSPAYEREQRFMADSERIERKRIQADNAAKMRQLNTKLSSGELDTVDPMRRLWNGLAPGERHGDRELRLLAEQLERYRAEDESDPRAVLAWLADHDPRNTGP